MMNIFQKRDTVSLLHFRSFGHSMRREAVSMQDGVAREGLPKLLPTIHGPFLEYMTWIEVKSLLEFTKLLDEHRFSIIFATSSDCFLCKLLKPKIQGLPSSFQDVSFITIDLDQADDALCQRSPIDQITRLPTFLFFHNARLVFILDKLPQKRPTRAIAQALKQQFESPPP